MRRIKAGLVIATATAVIAGGALLITASAGARTKSRGPRAHVPRVLRVGTWHGVRGQYRSIQAAVNAARPGDWILIAPGDYKEHGGLTPKGRSDLPSGVLITRPSIYIRGMNRNTVVVDGTRPGSPKCSSKPSDQEFGPSGKGLNGIMVWKADNVWVQNLTACNYLHGSGDTGNEIWWNGGNDTGKVGGWGYLGSYLNATTTFFQNEQTAAQYGIFSSNWSGGTWNWTYTSNFSDSGYYIGACQQVCDQTVNHAWSEYSVLGYSGSNSGGPLLVENSQFDNNQDGFDTNSQNGDEPSPQNGACPKGVKPPVKGAYSCWVFIHNFVHDNNNPNVPATGTAAAGPVGTGMSISGGRNDTVMDNLFERNGAWGTIFVPYPDSGPPCYGGNNYITSCWFDEWGDALIDNTYGYGANRNGWFGNNTNGDFAALNAENNEPTDCYSGNIEQGGHPVVTSPSNLQQMYPKCTGADVAPNLNFTFFEEVACDSQISFGPGGSVPCSPSDHYPRQTKPMVHPLPPARELATMPNPCAGVPANPWCPTHSRRKGGTKPTW